MDARLGGQHFLQTPGPSNVPEKVLRALARPTIDHRSQEFAELTRGLFVKLQSVFQTQQPVIIYPSSGTGAWEAALVNTLSPGDRVLAAETGHFATLWAEMGSRLGLRMDFIPGDWRTGADPEAIAARLETDTSHEIAAVTVVHNETSTGVTSRIPEIRAAMDRVGHPALLLVDTISSLASIDYRHDEWGVDVTVGCSQKGLMLPPGLGFNVVSEKALAAAKHAGLAKSYWGWDAIIAANRSGFFPYTPSTNLLFGLDVACDMLAEEGLSNVFARHDRHAAATRAAVTAWGLQVQCTNPAEYSSVLTAVVMPEGHDSNLVCLTSYEKYNMSLGIGLGKLNGRVFRIGHLGYFSDLSLCGTLAGVELTLTVLGVPVKSGGVQAAMELLG